MAEAPDSAQCRSIRAAIAAAFGTVRIDAITPVAGGASGALPFRVDSADRRWLVRLEGPASPLRNPHQYAAMRLAAAAGIAPRLHHVDPHARVAVMDFIEERPLSAYPGGPEVLVQALGDLLGRVQATPPFPQFIAYPDLVGRLWSHVRRTGLFAPGVLDAHTERLAQIRAAYAWKPAASVSSHNDPVPRNVLFDGERLWLIDWESACRNDPLVDPAIMLDGFGLSPDLGEVLLRAWLGRAPDGGIVARFALVRALTRLYYAGVLLSAAAAASGAAADRDLAVPTIEEFERAVLEGRVEPGAPDTKRVLGKMYLAAFLTGDAAPGLDAAVPRASRPDPRG